ncbi:ABC transporter permease [Roseovarius aquimarinus]|uniref:ABC transporter permease n=1 Tax=Roseovarius aquimarinus TaxID=1229156 RepID=A0ABW7I688_9RHOB
MIEAAARTGVAKRLLLLAVIAFLCLIPFLLIIAVSLGQKIDGAYWEWGLTLGNYKRFFVGADWPQTTSTLHLSQLWYSIYYAMVAAIAAVATAFPFTYLMTRGSSRRQTFWLIFFLSSVSLSEVFVAMGWDVLLSARSGLPMLFRETGITDWLKDAGWFGTLRDWGLATPRNVKFKPSGLATIVTMTYLVWPYAVILLYPPLSRLDRSTEEAARTMGARPFTVVRTVVLPQVRLPVIGAVLVLFVFLLGAYVVVAVFADTSKQTLAIAIYESVRGIALDAPFGAAQAMVLLVSAGAVLLFSTWLTRKKEGRA